MLWSQGASREWGINVDPSLGAGKYSKVTQVLASRVERYSALSVTSTKWPISWTVTSIDYLGGEGTGDTGPEQAQPEGKSNYGHRCKKLDLDDF